MCVCMSGCVYMSVCVCAHSCKPEIDLDVNPQKPAPLFLGGRVSL